MDPDLPLPPYLEPLPATDPRYDGLNSSAYAYAYGPEPGDGNLKEFTIVRFVEPHTAYRVWGGPASECGYWWILAPPSNCVEVCPQYDEVEYREVFAVCPEWNSMTNITAVDVPADATAVVGVGQSANCTDGLVLYPSEAILQLNGDACSVPSGYVSCAANGNFLQASECVKTCPGAILPGLDEDGVLRCDVRSKVGDVVPASTSAVGGADGFFGALTTTVCAAWLSWHAFTGSQR